MDPTHFLADQAFRHHGAATASRAEIDAFYERHGLDMFAAFARWRGRLSAAWRRPRTGRDRPAGFVPETQNA